MYANFLTTEKLGEPGVIDGRTLRFSEEKISGYISVKAEDYPEQFPQEIVTLPSVGLELRQKKEFKNGLHEGWENLPIWKWTGKAFEKYNPYNNLTIKLWHRRENLIQPEIQKDIKPGTELKKMRKAILALIEIAEAAVGGVKKNEDIAAFIEYSKSIEKKISKYDKAKAEKNIDLHEVNGAEKSRERFRED